MASKLEIKNRIRSVDSTKKITKAMQLVAASKLRKSKERMENNKEYAFYLKDSVDTILSSIKASDHHYLMPNNSKRVLTIVYTSDMGLCGGYNANVFKMIQEHLNPEDPMIILGSRGGAWVTRRGYQVVKSLYNVDEEAYEDIVDVANLALKMYVEKEIGTIQILYTEFINSMSFEPKIIKLLPVERNYDLEKDVLIQDTIFEPDGEAILDELVPLYLKSLLYSYWLETKTSEQASRQSAMENATDNAQELRDGLELKFNQARQAAITQEITEIVGGANAL
ncbi:F-type H+-transporting ATPase subunit gamma [Breznakia sp. PF5-3]|uniref:ATP synthase F1 subunit gamma n=1 Tax=unclassified Breznakia TaxID=2623764 RepID=UPI002407234A|nr:MULTISPECIES: ATP synthase F1 subunit gamma [unclassified Breznakia]MDL2276673.1 ATP synthase F1 subunit gamma [Breznakia sp. OttesenSCG-928-G09]MDF9825724.1 F-type H+-transporting ATPase subunit gamma [Breznakia sp. PM6-1]MDF9836554.1 F-type H+-transporting ATPase subunit gamma [Breznakia sp. PF5-3]MDF9838335.1 F-type H+-transporting ATPase subunit gamma [Breznakia sp. PFB2-8]MDF9860373.1 F-type H+-transporting ATPase subunit gamma [Breznakia sp. PH5-24]